ncbi:hypothetical protein MRX96_004757 [Rhipicephalus microplus]
MNGHRGARHAISIDSASEAGPSADRRGTRPPGRRAYYAASPPITNLSPLNSTEISPAALSLAEDAGPRPAKVNKPGLRGPGAGAVYPCGGTCEITNACLSLWERTARLKRKILSYIFQVSARAWQRRSNYFCAVPGVG